MTVILFISNNFVLQDSLSPLTDTLVQVKLKKSFFLSLKLQISNKVATNTNCCRSCRPDKNECVQVYTLIATVMCFKILSFAPSKIQFCTFLVILNPICGRVKNICKVAWGCSQPPINHGIMQFLV